MFGGLSVNTLMRNVVSFLDMPVKVILILFLIISLIMVGGLIAEIMQRKYLTVKAASVIDAIKKGKNNVTSIIKNSGLLTRQKRLLLELTIHESLSNEMKESFAASLLENYFQSLEFTIKKSDLIIKLGPTFGLLGTLIPLGPGIIALSSGDTATLSQSLLTAFDTTVIGLISAAICTVISLLRKKWYSKDKIMLSLIMEAVLESEKNNEKNN